MVETIYKSNIRLQISDEFIMLTEGVSMLRTLINTPEAGDTVKIFNIFKRHFEMFFILSSDAKAMNTEISFQVKNWIILKHEPLYKIDIEMGIELFYKYKSELFRLNVLE